MPRVRHEARGRGLPEELAREDGRLVPSGQGCHEGRCAFAAWLEHALPSPRSLEQRTAENDGKPWSEGKKLEAVNAASSTGRPGLQVWWFQLTLP